VFDHPASAQFTLPRNWLVANVQYYPAMAKATNGMITAFLFSTSP
jgi:hypothetical protein